MFLTSAERLLSFNQASRDAEKMSKDTSGIVAVIEIFQTRGYAAVCVREAIEQEKRIVRLVAEGFGIQDIEYPNFDQDLIATGIAQAIESADLRPVAMVVRIARKRADERRSA